MADYTVDRYVRGYEKVGEEYLWELKLLNLELKTIQKLFSIKEDCPMYEVYPINEIQLNILNKYLPFELPEKLFTKFDLFLEADSRE